MANGAFVPVSNNVRRLATAEGAIAVNALVTSLVEEVSNTNFADWLVDWDEAMSRMDEVGINNACSAVVPVWAVQAFVTYAVDVLRGLVSFLGIELDILLTLSQPSHMA